MVSLSEKDKVSTSVSLSHQETPISLLSFSIRGQKDCKPQLQKTNQSDHMALLNSMKLWALSCRATQEGPIMVDSWQNVGHWKGNGKPLQYSRLQNPMNSMKRQKAITLKGELLRSLGTQYATGDQWINRTLGTMKRWRQRKTKPSCGCDQWWK